MKKNWITNLRVLATLSVVLLHAAANGSEKVNQIPMTDWWISNLINTFGRFAVPVFVMLSGYLLLGKYDELGTFLSRRFGRVFIPFLVWSVVYLIWGNFYGYGFEVTGWEIGAIIKRILQGGIGGSGQLWFVYMLLGLYLFTPIISRWLKQATDSEIKFYLILWVISNVAFDYTEHFLKFQIKFDLRYFSGYMGYFVLGYWLGNREFNIPKWQSGLGFLVGWAGVAYLTYYFSFSEGKFSGTQTGYLSGVVMFMSASIFMFFKDACNAEFLPKITTELDAMSFGIYLIHSLLLKVLSRNYHINYTFIHPLVGIFTQFILCTIMSYVIVKALSKIPKVGSWFVG